MKSLPLPLLALAAASCLGDFASPIQSADPAADPAGSRSGDRYRLGITPAPATLKLLTSAQYANTVHDLFGAAVTLSAVDSDTPISGWIGIGASSAGISARGVEEFEASALDVARQVFADPAGRAAFVGCTPSGVVDDGCARGFLTRWGRRIWRRPLAIEEVDRYTALQGASALALDDFWRGAEVALAGLLESPNFLYRVELGEPDPDDPSRLRYDDHEMATRLSYFYWNSTPDEELLAAADRGELTTTAGITAQVARLLAAPRAHAALGNFFVELLGLKQLDALQKDTALFPRMTATLGSSMRGEIERAIEALVFARDADLRELFDTRQTFVNGELAELYGLPNVTGSDFVPVELPAAGLRAGLLGFAGTMALQAKRDRTSPTLRGLFIRNRFLCQSVPPPPPNTPTVLTDPPTTQPVTLRERLDQHRANPACSGCHSLMDPIGLGLENFDAVGAFRTLDQGHPIDASGVLDGVSFKDPLELAAALRNHPKTVDCVVRSLYRYASNHFETRGEEGAIQALVDRVVHDGHRLSALFPALATSDGFRFAAPPVDDPQGGGP